jgi:hypothetical protein
MEVTIVLKNFSANEFIRWLEYHISRPVHLGFSSFPANNGQGEYLLWGIESLDDITGATRVDVRVYYIEPARDEGAYAAVLSGEVDEAPSSWPPRRRLRDRFYFDIVPCGLAIEVIAWCGIPELIGFYKELLKKLAESHPEAEVTIAKALGTPVEDTGNREVPERLLHPEIRERRKNVKKLWTQGLTGAEIAVQLVVSESTVKRDRKALGLKTKS